jgi:hypothetical protein
MRPTYHRPFHVADALILTAATAFTLALLIQAPDWSDKAYMVFMGGGFRGYVPMPLFLRLSLKATYVLTPWTVAILIIRLSPPRPPLRRLVFQPGMAACGAATLWLAFKMSLLLVLTAIPNKWMFVFMYLGDGVALTSWAAPAVAGAWSVLALSGRWRPERGWIDRSGRLLGASWLVLEALNNIRILY